jgi:hypothetical protein
MRFQDDSFREFRDAFGDLTSPTAVPFVPERTFLVGITLNF